MARFGPIVLLAAAVTAASSVPLAAAEPDDLPAVQLRAALPFEPGAWRTRSQPVFDAHAQELRRKTYTVWDPMPSRGLDFTWIPDRRDGPEAERVTGTGRVVWRLPGRPAYDPSAVQAEYRGAMRAGRADGFGTFEDRRGLTYEGRWVAGLPDGEGTLAFGNGAEFAGRFAAGIAEGPGRFYDVDGEVFEGRFRQGYRDGRGRTVLPGGGAYQSDWAMGEEVANSRKLRLAQIGPVRGPADDVRLGVSVDRIDDPSLLQYGASNRESALVVEPSRKRLMAVWKGDEAIQLLPREEGPGERGSYGIFSYSAADVPPLVLVFEVQNRGGAPVRVRGAYLDVDASVTDLQPAIQLTAGSSGGCGARDRADYSPSFTLQNLGWGPAERARLRFAFTRPGTNPPPAATSVAKEIGTIRGDVRVDMEAELRNAGVKVDQLKRRGEPGGGGLACRSKGNPTACLSEIAGSGLFGTLGRSLALEDRDVFLNATGTLGYAWRDIKGAEAARTSPFSARLLLGRTPIEAECGEGAEKEPVGKRPLEFRLDQTGYRLPVAFERTIPAGRTARYTVAVKAGKASEHQFKVVLQMADGRLVTSRPIALTYFLPSRFSEGSSTE